MSTKKTELVKLTGFTDVGQEICRPNRAMNGRAPVRGVSRGTLVALLLAATALNACGTKGSGDGGGGAHIGTFDRAGTKLMTDLSSCGEGSAVRSPIGRWAAVWETDDGSFSMLATLDIRAQSLIATNLCQFQGRQLSVEARAPLTITDRMLELLGTDSQSKHIDEDGFHLNCDVDLKPQRLNYRAYGSCLKISMEGSTDEMTLVPADRAKSSRPASGTVSAPGANPPGPAPTVPPTTAPAPPAPPSGPPAPPSAPDAAWACLIDNRSTNSVYIGYGKTEFMASTLAKQSCRAGADGGYCNDDAIACGAQEASSDAWFCEADNRASKRVYTGLGRSQAEATYAARKACIEGDRPQAYYCAKGDDVTCARQ